MFNFKMNTDLSSQCLYKSLKKPYINVENYFVQNFSEVVEKIGP